MRKTNFSTHFFHPFPESGSGRHTTANAGRSGYRAAGAIRPEATADKTMPPGQPGGRRSTAGIPPPQDRTASAKQIKRYCRDSLADTGVQIDTAGIKQIKQDDRRRRAG